MSTHQLRVRTLTAIQRYHQNPASFRHMATTTPRISLNPPERLFRQCLLDCRDEMQHVPGMKSLTLRWTGGWVRDKLLGTSSHDIDVALSTMTGMQFGEALKEFMDKHGHRYEKEAEAGGFKAEVKNLHKIAANPEKSKHLETITTRMFGIDVDFVNLRKEVYHESSRNPQMEFGTPEEDALRRDATVNALFYNLDEEKVEDFTRRGLVDMNDRIIRTPLEPYQTFRDDPLRVLRLIRFASRLDYNIESDALQAMSDLRIHEALRLKISRERVGVEVGKIVAGPDPHRGLTLINELALYQSVFANPLVDYCPSVTNLPKVYNSLLEILDHNSAICMGLKPKDDQALTWTLAAYTPWKDSEASAVAAAREAIRATNVFSKVLGDAIKNRSKIHQLVSSIENGSATRGQVGMSIRGLGTTWPAQVMYAVLCDMAGINYDVVVERYGHFLHWLTIEKMMDAAALKPILNGNDIKKALSIQNAGAWLKGAIEKVVEWQFENPQGTAEQAKNFINSKRDELV